MKTIHKNRMTSNIGATRIPTFQNSLFSNVRNVYMAPVACELNQEMHYHHNNQEQGRLSRSGRVFWGSRCCRMDRSLSRWRSPSCHWCLNLLANHIITNPGNLVTSHVVVKLLTVENTFRNFSVCTTESCSISDTGLSCYVSVRRQGTLTGNAGGHGIWM